MSQWLRRVRGVFGFGFIWAAAMAGIGGAIELVDNVVPGLLPFANAIDMWPQTLAIPGFIGGTLFGVVLAIAQRRRRFDELSLPGFAAWGAVGGAVLGGIGVALGAPLVFVGVATVVSAGAATGSLAIARLARARQMHTPLESPQAAALEPGDE